MGDRLLRGLNHLVDDVFGRSAVGIAHAEVDDVFSTAARGDFHFAGDVEDIGRQALNTAELFHGSLQNTGIRDKGSGSRDRGNKGTKVRARDLDLDLG